MSQTGVHFLKSACAVAMFALPRLTDVVKDRCHARKVPTTHLSIATIHCYSINSSVPATGSLLRQRVWTYLDMHGARFRTLAALHHPWHAIAAGAPQSAALPAGVWVVNASVEALGEKAQRVRDAQHHHLPVLESNESVIEIGG